MTSPPATSAPKRLRVFRFNRIGDTSIHGVNCELIPVGCSAASNRSVSVVSGASVAPRLESNPTTTCRPDRSDASQNRSQTFLPRRDDRPLGSDGLIAPAVPFPRSRQLTNPEPFSGKRLRSRFSEIEFPQSRERIHQSPGEAWEFCCLQPRGIVLRIAEIRTIPVAEDFVQTGVS